MKHEEGDSGSSKHNVPINGPLISPVQCIKVYLEAGRKEGFLFFIFTASQYFEETLVTFC